MLLASHARPENCFASGRKSGQTRTDARRKPEDHNFTPFSKRSVVRSRLRCRRLRWYFRFRPAQQQRELARTLRKLASFTGLPSLGLLFSRSYLVLTGCPSTRTWSPFDEWQSCSESAMDSLRLTGCNSLASVFPSARQGSLVRRCISSSAA